LEDKYQVSGEHLLPPEITVFQQNLYFNTLTFSPSSPFCLDIASSVASAWGMAFPFAADLVTTFWQQILCSVRQHYKNKGLISRSTTEFTLMLLPLASNIAFCTNKFFGIALGHNLVGSCQ
jgi:hypothetical protein